jgi:hypothetical protein
VTCLLPRGFEGAVRGSSRGEWDVQLRRARADRHVSQVLDRPFTLAAC